MAAGASHRDDARSGSLHFSGNPLSVQFIPCIITFFNARRTDGRCNGNAPPIDVRGNDNFGREEI